MKLRLATAAIAAGMLVLSGVATTSAMEARTENDPVCTGIAPFREVAQDEVYTFDERCSMREVLGADRGGVGSVGWAKASGSVLPRKH